jgi:hypothetical protein
MKNSKTAFIAFGLFSTLFLFSCKKEAEPATCSGTISYADDITPILTANCTGCHNSTIANGGYNLTTHANVSANAAIILNSMRHAKGVDAMPQGGSKLPTETIDKFDCWLQQGKQDN